MDVGDNGGAGRGGVGPHPLVHALLVTVAMLLLPGTSHAQETCTPGDDIWCGVVTVGEVPLLAATCMQMDSRLPARVLTPWVCCRRTVSRSERTITRSMRSSLNARRDAGQHAQRLRFRLTNPLATADRAGLVLHAGGSSFAFRDSNPRS